MPPLFGVRGTLAGDFTRARLKHLPTGLLFLPLIPWRPQGHFARTERPSRSKRCHPDQGNVYEAVRCFTQSLVIVACVYGTQKVPPLLTFSPHHITVPLTRHAVFYEKKNCPASSLTFQRGFHYGERIADMLCSFTSFSIKVYDMSFFLTQCTCTNANGHSL